MIRSVTLIAVFLIGLCRPALYAAIDPAKTLRTDLNRIFSEPRLARAQVGVSVFSLDRSEILYEKNPQRRFLFLGFAIF